MPSNSKFTRDDDGNVAVRVVSNTGVSEQPDSMFTTDEDGNVAVRVVFGEGGGGGGDSHNKGYYATPTALNEAVPTAEAGDYAIVGSTDTVWIWDTDTSAWVDSDQKGQVTSVNNQTGDVTITGADVLPTQTGNSGKFLTTNGTGASWGATIDGSTLVVKNTASSQFSAVDQISFYAKYNNSDGTAATIRSTSIGTLNFSGTSSVFDGSILVSSAGKNLGSAGTKWTTVYVTKINNGADIAVPTVAGSMSVQVSSMPTADSTLEGQIYQFTGATDSTYTNGRFYKCVSDGQNPATYSWEEVSMGGGSSYTAGTGIDITNGTISVASPVARLEIASGSLTGSVYGMWAKTTTISPYRCLVLGHNASINSTNASGAVVLGAEAVGGNGTTSVGAKSSATVADGIAIGNAAISTSQGAVQIGYGTNSTANTFQWKSYRLVSSDGTIPTARLTKVNSTITLAAADWSSNTQTVNVTGMTADGVVMVSPDPTDQSAYTSAGILCTAQAAGTLTFTCDTVPSGDIDVNVVML